VSTFLAVDSARLSLSFTTGLIASINPCGFVLLPTYLMYFLGIENLRPGEQRGSVARALKVGAAVSAGFLLLFMIVGLIIRLISRSVQQYFDWVSLGIGVALLVLGIAMIFGYRMPFTTPKLDIGQRDRTVGSMFVFGIAYGIASIGCTIGPFTGTVLGSFSSADALTGLLAIVLYSVAMALVVVALTVTLAMANTGLLRVLRKGMAWFEYLSGIFVLLTGLYLTWYWYSTLREDYDNGLTSRATGWQSDLTTWVQNHQWTIVTVLGFTVVTAVVWSLLRIGRQSTIDGTR
jgi:cytochrome c-type biogenesis protein